MKDLIMWDAETRFSQCRYGVVLVLARAFGWPFAMVKRELL